MYLEFFTNAYIAMMLGLVEWKNDKEFWWGGHGGKITIEFPTNSPTKAIVKSYPPSWGSSIIKKIYEDGEFIDIYSISVENK